MAGKFRNLQNRNLQNLGKLPVIAVPRETYARHRYSTPLFVLHETLNAFKYHNGLGLSASLSFYAMFALIPMALLVFFMLSHLIVSSDYALVKLAILTSNLVPKLSNRIMIEVYNLSSHQAVWGVFGLLALLWVITPLAGALRSAFYSISSLVETPSFIKGKIKDVLAVLGILSLFFLLFLSLAVGFYISDRMDNSYSGFFFVTLFYLLVAVIVYLSRKSIERPVVNGIIKSFLATKPEEKNENPR